MRFETGRIEIRTWAKRVDFRIWVRPGQLGQRVAPRVVGSDGTVSIVEIVSLSPRVEKPKSQEGNKSFVPERPEVVSVSGFLCIMNILRIHIVLWICYRKLGMHVIHESMLYSNNCIKCLSGFNDPREETLLHYLP